MSKTNAKKTKIKNPSSHPRVSKNNFTNFLHSLFFQKTMPSSSHRKKKHGHSEDDDEIVTTLLSQHHQQDKRSSPIGPTLKGYENAVKNGTLKAKCRDFGKDPEINPYTGHKLTKHSALRPLIEKLCTLQTKKDEVKRLRRHMQRLEENVASLRPSSSTANAGSVAVPPPRTVHFEDSSSSTSNGYSSSSSGISSTSQSSSSSSALSSEPSASSASSVSSGSPRVSHGEQTTTDDEMPRPPTAAIPPTIIGVQPTPSIPIARPTPRLFPRRRSVVSPQRQQRRVSFSATTPQSEIQGLQLEQEQQSTPLQQQQQQQQQQQPTHVTNNYYYYCPPSMQLEQQPPQQIPTSATIARASAATQSATTANDLQRLQEQMMRCQAEEQNVRGQLRNLINDLRSVTGNPQEIDRFLAFLKTADQEELNRVLFDFITTLDKQTTERTLELLNGNAVDNANMTERALQAVADLRRRIDQTCRPNLRVGVASVSSVSPFSSVLPLPPSTPSTSEKTIADFINNVKEKGIEWLHALQDPAVNADRLETDLILMMADKSIPDSIRASTDHLIVAFKEFIKDNLEELATCRDMLAETKTIQNRLEDELSYAEQQQQLLNAEIEQRNQLIAAANQQANNEAYVNQLRQENQIALQNVAHWQKEAETIRNQATEYARALAQQYDEQFQQLRQQIRDEAAEYVQQIGTEATTYTQQVQAQATEYARALAQQYDEQFQQLRQQYAQQMQAQYATEAATYTQQLQTQYENAMNGTIEQLNTVRAQLNQTIEQYEQLLALFNNADIPANQRPTLAEAEIAQARLTAAQEVRDTMNEQIERECSICMFEYDGRERQKIILPCCGGAVCQTCLGHMRQCPFCRVPI
jgi:hypothetical protein